MDDYNTRTLTLHSECSIIKGMIDTKLIPKDVIYPIDIIVRSNSNESLYPDGVMIHQGSEFLTGTYFT